MLGVWEAGLNAWWIILWKVHCKLDTRASQNNAYRRWRAAVKFILCSGSAGMCSSRCGKFSPAGGWKRCCNTGHRQELIKNASEKPVP